MTLSPWKDRSDGELHGHWAEHAWTKSPLEAGHVEYLRDPEGVGYQLELAILEYFVHVLLSPLVLLHGALDSNHGSSMPVLLCATILHVLLLSIDRR